MKLRAAELSAYLVVCAALAFAATTGSISGTVKDPSGAVIAGATIIATNTANGTETKATSDDNGLYAFPSLAVGRYTLKVEEEGFGTQTKTGLVIDADSALKIDLTMQMAEKVEEVTVLENAAQVETTSSQMGQVVTGTQMTAVALNGRSYTDLLALQPGIVPMSTQQPDSIVMAGASVAIAPSGGLNPGNQSISGQREDANGFMVNGGDVKELMNGGTTIVPNLDSIAEFRVLTNNFDAEYGNYSGGIVNVVTKSGGNQVHGSGLRVSAQHGSRRPQLLFAGARLLPAKPVRRHRRRADPQEQDLLLRRLSGNANRSGHRYRLDRRPDRWPTAAEISPIRPASLTGTVSGPYLANLLSQKLGYTVSANEPYYSPGCTSNIQCVFPNAVIPQSAWSAPAQHLLQYIPAAQPRAIHILDRRRRPDRARRQRAASAWTPTASAGACSRPTTSSTTTT